MRCAGALAPGAATATAVNATLQAQLNAVGLAGQKTHLRQAVERGSAGQTDWVHQLDLNLAYRFFGAEDGGQQVIGTIDVFNVLDDNAVTRVVEQGEVRTSASGQKGVQAPFYGLPRTRQGGRAIRFGLRYSF